jgi:hypothetical protein
MAPWEPWRKMRLEEIDRSLQVVVEDRDPRMRALQIQMFVIAAVAPLADERGLSERTSTADMSRPAQSDEHVFTANRNFYRVPKGTFPVLDDFMEIWQQRETRRDAMKLAEADRFDIDEPFPLDRFAINRLEQLASEARVAIERRSEPY